MPVAFEVKTILFLRGGGSVGVKLGVALGVKVGVLVEVGVHVGVNVSVGVCVRVAVDVGNANVESEFEEHAVENNSKIPTPIFFTRIEQYTPVNFMDLYRWVRSGE